ncbi:MAG TPA: hypothetical protein H9881_05530 [Candidatus Stackebrandtia excrementipullorum]|nr:hypothetical protein [Candidatus Stackebrandtia excrementipullorum]
MTIRTHASRLLSIGVCAAMLSFAAACGGSDPDERSADPEEVAAVQEVLDNDERFAAGPLDDAAQAALCEAVAAGIDENLAGIPNQNGACWIEGLEAITVSIEARVLSENDLHAVPLLIVETDGQADVCEVVEESEGLADDLVGNVEETDAGAYCRIESDLEENAAGAFLDASHVFVVQSVSCTLPCPNDDAEKLATSALTDVMSVLMEELVALRG